MAALVEGETHDGVAALQERVVDRHVGLSAGMRLHVGVFGAEEGLGAFARKLLDLVDDLAAAVVAPSGIALRVLGGEHRADRLQHGERGVALGGNQLQVRARALLLVVDERCDLGILRLERSPEVHVGGCSFGCVQGGRWRV